MSYGTNPYEMERTVEDIKGDDVKLEDILSDPKITEQQPGYMEVPMQYEQSIVYQTSPCDCSYCQSTRKFWGKEKTPPAKSAPIFKIWDLLFEGNKPKFYPGDYDILPTSEDKSIEDVVAQLFEPIPYPKRQVIPIEDAPVSIDYAKAERMIAADIHKMTAGLGNLFEIQLKQEEYGFSLKLDKTKFKLQFSDETEKEVTIKIVRK